MDGYFDLFCQRVISCDGAIRSVRAANGLGRILGSSYRAGLAHMRNDEEELHSLRSVLRAALREDFEPVNGRLRYSLSVYERLARATVPLKGGGNPGDKLYLLVAFEPGADIGSIITGKIFPEIERAGIKEEKAGA
ncbi:MAG: hypothetical protein QXJ74_00070 [Nitrososphaera sp.]|uniref:hypothetical protein n=1 Tax=Nitrososphaera sp. TaxID=1971748 RepID=UPI0017E64A5A|nr:hypothetical protein [Nitrososphaera sp.]NWG36428.1 hypothetical protein [Nitrososphaera sp.]